MSGNFGNFSGPATRQVAITPNDSTDLAYPVRGLYVGGTGNVVCISTGGDTATYAGVPAGTIIPVAVSRVLATGTTATSIVGMV